MPAGDLTSAPTWDTVLFDMGGVLVSDVWETLLLTPKRGLADKLGLKRSEVRTIAEQLWRSYSVREADEADYWRDLEKRLDVEIPTRDREQCYSLLVVDRSAGDVLRELAELQIRIGVITNNTTFWFQRQLQLVPELRDLGSRELCFLSCLVGETKRESPGLFGIAAENLTPEKTLIVDDRAHNLAIAQSLGFITHRHKINAGPLLPTLATSRVLSLDQGTTIRAFRQCWPSINFFGKSRSVPLPTGLRS